MKKAFRLQAFLLKKISAKGTDDVIVTATQIVKNGL
jgi:hypothetical protein